MTLRPCPICRRPAELATRPFCSARCRNVDLQRWLSGDYAIPGDLDPDEAEGVSGQPGGPRL